MNSNEHRGVTCAAKSAILPLPASSISPNAYSSSMDEKSCFASLLVIQPGISYGSALIDAASRVLLLPSRRRAGEAEGEPCNSSDFHHSHRPIICPSSLDPGILFKIKVTIKRCRPHHLATIADWQHV